MYTSIIAPLLFASFAIAQSTFLTTSPFVDVYCAYEGSGCGAANRESGTLGFFVSKYNASILQQRPRRYPIHPINLKFQSRSTPTQLAS